MTDDKVNQVQKAMNTHKLKQLKRLFDVRHNGLNEMDNYLRGLVSHGITETQLIAEIESRRESK